jgi:hypothetical protein
LSVLEKVILLEVDSLDNGEGCWAGNDYLAEFCQCSERKVSEAVSKLIKLGYLRAVSFDGRRRFLTSCVAEKVRETSRNCEAHTQNLRPINITNNITNNKRISLSRNTTVDKPRKSGEETTFKKPSLEEVREVIIEKGYNVDAEAKIAFYDSNGWKVGKDPLQSWKSALVTWHKRHQGDAAPQAAKPKYERF